SDNPNDPDYIRTTGMGWFPGYTINLETGERMNMMFGEDSYLVADNGRDMLFNPTKNEFDGLGRVVFGGKHYVYIVGNKVVEWEQFDLRFDFPAYDAGKSLADVIGFDTISVIQDIYRTIAYASSMYVGMPLSNPDEEWLSNDVTVKIRIGKPYARFNSVTLDATQEWDSTLIAGSDNDFYPMYEFSTEDIATTMYNGDKADNDLDLIGVVPNPYYAYSSYERNALDNRVKIINLPEKCRVSIYTVNGILVRSFTKDDPITSLDWDLKNSAGIPVAGGVYLVHVKDEATGAERIVKWFGSLRVEDFNRF
ncbi:MAG: T9SS C-terminal target domain-containing protein, partial [Bacteroidetes bacterium]